MAEGKSPKPPPKPPSPTPTLPEGGGSKKPQATPTPPQGGASLSLPLWGRFGGGLYFKNTSII